MSVGRHRLPARLDLTTTVDGATTSLRVDGELDSETIERFEETLDLIFARNNLRRLVLDFGSLSYLGSVGIHALLTAHQRKPLTVALVVVNCPAHARQALQVSGLFDALVKPDLDTL